MSWVFTPVCLANTDAASSASAKGSEFLCIVSLNSRAGTSRLASADTLVVQGDIAGFETLGGEIAHFGSRDSELFRTFDTR